MARVHVPRQRCGRRWRRWAQEASAVALARRTTCRVPLQGPGAANPEAAGPGAAALGTPVGSSRRGLASGPQEGHPKNTPCRQSGVLTQVWVEQSARRHEGQRAAHQRAPRQLQGADNLLGAALGGSRRRLEPLGVPATHLGSQRRPLHQKRCENAWSQCERSGDSGRQAKGDGRRTRRCRSPPRRRGRRGRSRRRWRRAAPRSRRATPAAAPVPHRVRVALRVACRVERPRAEGSRARAHNDVHYLLRSA